LSTTATATTKLLRRLQSLSSRYGAAALTVAALTIPDRWIFVSLLGIWGAFYVKPDIALVCVIYATGGLLWAADPLEGLDVWFGLIALYGAYTLFKTDRLLPEAITVSVIINCIGFYIYDPARWAGFGNENFLVEFLLIAFPFVWIAWKRALIWMNLACCAAVLMTGMILVRTASDTLPFVLGAVVIWLCWVLLRSGKYWTATTLALLLVNTAFLSGLLTRADLWKSVFERFELACNTIVMWSDAPFFGWGIGSFNFMYPEYQERHLAWLQDTALHDVVLFAGAAHNEYAQALAEYGIVGVLLFALFLMRQRITAPVFVAGVICLVGFPLQNPATALLVAAGLSLPAPLPRLWRAASLLWPVYRSMQQRLS
jgi:hypothetical protein